MRWLPTYVVLLTLPTLACWPSGDSSTSATGGDPTATAAGETTTTGGETDSDTDAGTETGGLPPSFWPGVRCAAEPAEEGAAPKVYFDLDAGRAPELDFFRLPFPIDTRLVGGGVDLEGFPRPPADLDPVYGSVVERWLKHLQGETAGFAVNGAVLFRNSSGIGELGGVHFLDITPSSPDYGKAVRGLRFRAENGTPSRNNYICENWLAVELIDGSPLRPATTYAVLLSDKLKPTGGGTFVADDDFAAMLGDQTPQDSITAAAWQDFTLLRDFLKSPANTGGEGPQLSKGELVGGTVFTTAPNHDPLVGAREVVDTAPFVVTDLHLCDGVGDSPCSTAPGLSDEERDKRRCGAASGVYDEIHGRIRIPIFQEGIAPYPSVGGAIDVDAEGPVIRSTVDACFAATIPKGELPEGGWPAVVYADGTAGSFRGALRSGLASRLAPDGVATLGLEPVLHGERRGDDDDDGLVEGQDVYQLVFNVFNPDSARDTVVQGALDQLSVVRLAEQWTDDTLLGGSPIRFNPEALAFVGHSLGANAGSLILPFAPQLRAAVLSGGGANLPQALLAKAEPKVQNPITNAWMTPKELLQAAFQERPDRPLAAYHPMLVLLNTYVNRSDADNTARHIRREPFDPEGAKHMLMYLGYVDSYTPLRAAGSLAIGIGLEIGAANLFPGPCDAYDDADQRMGCSYTTNNWLPLTELPATANLSGETAVLRMLDQPAAKDGHFVFYEPAELDRARAFLVSALKGEGPPTIP